jgi:hypothetical protein
MRTARGLLLVTAIAAGAVWLFSIVGAARQLSTPLGVLRTAPVVERAARFGGGQGVAEPAATSGIVPAGAADRLVPQADAWIERPSPAAALSGAQIMRLLEDELAGTDPAAADEVLRVFDESLAPER